MQYTNLIQDMKWSYSRIKAFTMCPYQFLLKYIKCCGNTECQFFSDYGSFVHKIIEQRLIGQLPQDDMAVFFLTNFFANIRGVPPSTNILNKYLLSGKNYLSNFTFPYMPLCVEKQYDFKIENFDFTGIVDCVAEENEKLIIVDHKSRALKKRSGRKKPTISDKELDEYLKQLYLYSIPIEQQFGKYPDRLEFNCFRTNMWISEPFVYDDFIKAKNWAVSMINTILNNDDWSPKLDYWKCKYICDQNQNCEYFKLNER